MTNAKAIKPDPRFKSKSMGRPAQGSSGLGLYDKNIRSDLFNFNFDDDESTGREKQNETPPSPFGTPTVRKEKPKADSKLGKNPALPSISGQGGNNKNQGQ